MRVVSWFGFSQSGIKDPRIGKRFVKASQFESGFWQVSSLLILYLYLHAAKRG